jgi:hypothetical protein
VNTAASQQYAVEGRTVVLAPAGITGRAACDTFTDTEARKELLKLGGGHTLIIRRSSAENTFDALGRCSRPDVLQLGFQRNIDDARHRLEEAGRRRLRGSLLPGVWVGQILLSAVPVTVRCPSSSARTDSDGIGAAANQTSDDSEKNETRPNSIFDQPETD